MENNYVSFDGKDLTFFVDNVEITNGKLPDSYELASEYIINGDSLGRLLAALTDSHYIAEFCETRPIWLGGRIKGSIYSRESIVKKLVSHNKELEARAERLYNAIYCHNRLSWFGRTRKIEIHEEQLEL